VPVVASFVGQSGGAFPTITSYRDIGAPTVDGANGTPRAGAETRASAIGVKHCIWF
jgi:hypothetical protein